MGRKEYYSFPSLGAIELFFIPFRSSFFHLRRYDRRYLSLNSSKRFVILIFSTTKNLPGVRNVLTPECVRRVFPGKMNTFLLLLFFFFFPLCVVFLSDLSPEFRGRCYGTSNGEIIGTLLLSSCHLFTPFTFSLCILRCVLARNKALIRGYT